MTEVKRSLVTAARGRLVLRAAPLRFADVIGDGGGAIARRTVVRCGGCGCWEPLPTESARRAGRLARDHGWVWVSRALGWRCRDCAPPMLRRRGASR